MISFWKLVLICTLLAFCMVSGDTKQLTVHLDHNAVRIQQTINSDGAAWGTFEDGLNITGWGVLDIQTSSQYTDQQQHYGAGLVEGFLTAERIYEHYLNMKFEFFEDKDIPEEVSQFLSDQYVWSQEKVQELADSDDVWDQVRNLNAQLQGLADGYALSSQGEVQPLDFEAFQILQAVGDLLDLVSAVDPSTRKEFYKMSPEDFEHHVSTTGHCSGLVKVLGDLSDIMVAHSSWFTYQAMNRIYKHYNFDFNKNVAARRISFSSYPGFLESLDDFYVMDSGLVMTQTTNNIFDTDLYDLVKPSSLFAWQRVRIANALAEGGEEWANYFRQFNSGTYNNQYMIIDYNKFVPNEELPDNLLWVVEQIPGLVVAKDKTDTLRRGYWPSYNVAFFAEIYDKSGYPEIVKKFGESYSYQLAARAEIYRRDEGQVIDLESLKRLMRSNDYLTDPYAESNPFQAICSRGDLKTSNSSPDGCYDTKVTNNALRKTLSSFALNGPTTNDGELTAFSWSTYDKEDVYSHLGHPDTFNFTFVLMSPKTLH